jgi:hypothetical protein
VNRVISGKPSLQFPARDVPSRCVAANRSQRAGTVLAVRNRPAAFDMRTGRPMSGRARTPYSVSSRANLFITLVPGEDRDVVEKLLVAS